jgi:GGDEF domain-containing protein
MSLGVASYPLDASDGESLLQRGDAAMYRAKQSGRNRVMTSSAGPVAVRCAAPVQD